MSMNIFLLLIAFCKLRIDNFIIMHYNQYSFSKIRRGKIDVKINDGLFMLGDNQQQALWKARLECKQAGQKIETSWLLTNSVFSSVILLLGRSRFYVRSAKKFTREKRIIMLKITHYNRYGVTWPSKIYIQDEGRMMNIRETYAVPPARTMWQH